MTFIEKLLCKFNKHKWIIVRSKVPSDRPFAPPETKVIGERCIRCLKFKKKEVIFIYEV